MISLLITLVIIGVILWFVETYIPMDPAFKTGVRILAAIFALLIVLNAFGINVLGAPAIR